VVLLLLVVPVAKMRKVVLKMPKEVIKKLLVEKVHQEKVAEKEERKMKARWKVRLVIQN
jgi:hypothetical protein